MSTPATIRARPDNPAARYAVFEGRVAGRRRSAGDDVGPQRFGLVLGFLELHASQSQGRFHTELEEWLAGATRLPAASPQTAMDGEPPLQEDWKAALLRLASPNCLVTFFRLTLAIMACL